MASSWNHRVWRLDERAVDSNDRFGETCATARCQDLATHATRWDYVTGRRGRVSYTTRQVCAGHAQKFAGKHGLTIGDPPPPRRSPVAVALAAMTAGEIHQVRIHSRHQQWYLEERRTGNSFLATSSRWLAGVPRDGTLDQAIAEAERLLARTVRLVPAAPWRYGEDDATVEVIPAHRHDAWLDHPWDLTVACGADGMWTLTRTLDDRFASDVTSLGNHNMSLGRALRVATDLLATQGWVTFCHEWATYHDDTAHVGAWHPDQVDPGRWRTPQAAAAAVLVDGGPS